MKAEVAIKGDIVFQGYWHNDAATAEVIDAEGWFATGDLGQLDDDGYLSITGRKKELIVTAGGKNVAPAVLEDRVRAHALVSQCMVIGDKQPFIAALLTIDEDAFPAWKEANGKPANASVADLREDETLRGEIQLAIDDANKAVSQAESIRVFRILPGDFTEANGMLTPSLKVKAHRGREGVRRRNRRNLSLTRQQFGLAPRSRRMRSKRSAGRCAWRLLVLVGLLVLVTTQTRVLLIWVCLLAGRGAAGLDAAVPPAARVARSAGRGDRDRARSEQYRRAGRRDRGERVAAVHRGTRRHAGLEGRLRESMILIARGGRSAGRRGIIDGTSTIRPTGSPASSGWSSRDSRRASSTPSSGGSSPPPTRGRNRTPRPPACSPQLRTVARRCRGRRSIRADRRAPHRRGRRASRRSTAPPCFRAAAVAGWSCWPRPRWTGGLGDLAGRRLRHRRGWASQQPQVTPRSQSAHRPARATM
jgi:hypothetical protein